MTVTELRQALAGSDPQATVLAVGSGVVVTGVSSVAANVVVLTVEPIGPTAAPGWRGEHGPEHPNAG